MRSRLKITGCAMVLVLCLTASGCGRESFTRDSGEKSSTEDIVTEPSYVDSMDDLESGSYYVYHDGKYYKPVWGDTSFDVTKTGASVKKTTFFTDAAFGTIPTLYEGDYLVYYMDSAFEEAFVFDRYRYVGYTIGISNLTQTASGRYSFDATSENRSIAVSSDAFRLTALEKEGVILDSIGKAELRAGNMDAGGTVLGLKANEYYAAELYVGTKLQKYTLKADAIALTSMESFSSNDYRFLKSKIIRINFPQSMNTGYYAVNGGGLFRYVKGKSYNENTDFNVANDLKTVKAEIDTAKKELREDNTEPFSVPFTVQRESDITVLVSYKEEEDVKFDYDAPVVKVVGKSVVYTLGRNGKTFSDTIHLTTGQYTLMITGMSGREYEYTVSAKETK